MTMKKQSFIILIGSILLGLCRFFILDDPNFSLIKQKRQLKDIKSEGSNQYSIPDVFVDPILIDLDFAKHLFDSKSAIFIDSRELDDYNNGHILSAINIPFDYHEEYEDVIDSLDYTLLYVIYCNGTECSLSLDLADYLFNDKAFEKILIFEGGWPEWKEAQYPSELANQNRDFTENKNISKDQTLNIKNPDNIIFWITILCGLFVLIHFLSNNNKIFLFKSLFDKIDISFLPRMLLGIIFIYASYYKIIDPISFSKNIHNYHLVPIWTENLAALIIPWLELIIGINLILGVFIEGSKIIIISLLIFFIFILSQAAIRGIDVHCGCFQAINDLAKDQGSQFKLIKRIIEDIVMLAMAFFIKKNK
tara:strand:- start:389 stop:1480 length:1092 start_codon:yes stop_codon:yes gene_type:complete